MISKNTINSGRLFTLIFSLSKSERRYISVVLKTHKENNKYKDVIDAVFKNIDLKTAFKNDNVGVLKNDTYYFILRCLRSYNANKSIKQKLNNYLSSIEILTNKSMYNEAYKELEKALLLSEKYSENTYSIKLISWKRIISNANVKLELKENDINESFLDVKNSLAIISSINDYWELSNKIFIQYKKYYIKKDAIALSKLKILLEDKLLDNCDKCCPKAKLVFYNLITIKHQVNGKIKDILQSTQDAIDLIENNEDLFNETKSLYFNSLYNNIIIAIELQAFETASENINKFIEIKPSLRKNFTKKDEIYVFKSHLFLNVNLLNSTGKFEEAINFSLDKFAKFEKLKNRIDDLSQWKFLFQIALSYFYLKDYSKSLNWINKIMDSENINWKKESFNINLLYNILLYELGYDSLLLSNVRSFKRMIKLSKKDDNSYKDSLMTLLTHLSNKKSKQNQEVFKDVLKSFKKNSKIKKDNAFLIFWLKSKSYNQNLTKIARENSLAF